MNCAKCKRPIVQSQTYYFKNGKALHAGECPKLAVEHFVVTKLVTRWEISDDDNLTKKEAEARLRVRQKQHPREKFRVESEAAGEPRGPEITD